MCIKLVCIRINDNRFQSQNNVFKLVYQVFEITVYSDVAVHNCTYFTVPIHLHVILIISIIEAEGIYATIHTFTYMKHLLSNR